MPETSTFQLPLPGSPLPPLINVRRYAMDSIMKDDDGKNEEHENEQFKTRELRIEGEVEAEVEEEVVVIRNGRAVEK